MKINSINTTNFKGLWQKPKTKNKTIKYTYQPFMDETQKEIDASIKKASDSIYGIAKSEILIGDKLPVTKAQYKFIANNIGNYKKTLDEQESAKPLAYQNILAQYGVESLVSEENMLILDEYHKPQGGKSWAEVGIDEDDLFKHVSSIIGNADFEGTQVTNLGNLGFITGRANFSNSEVVSLGEITEIWGAVSLENSKVEDFGRLKRIRFN